MGGQAGMFSEFLFPDDHGVSGGDLCTYFICEKPVFDMVKIGFTDAGLSNRISQLQTGNPRRLVSIGSLPGNLEPELHAKFSATRISKDHEWFTVSEALATYAASQFNHSTLRVYEGNPPPVMGNVPIMGKLNGLRTIPEEILLYNASKMQADLHCSVRSWSVKEYEDIVRRCGVSAITPSEVRIQLVGISKEDARRERRGDARLVPHCPKPYRRTDWRRTVSDDVLRPHSIRMQLITERSSDNWLDEEYEYLTNWCGGLEFNSYYLRLQFECMRKSGNTNHEFSRHGPGIGWKER